MFGLSDVSCATAATPTAATGIGEAVWVSLTVDCTHIEWRTMSLEKNEPRATGRFPLFRLERCAAHCAAPASAGTPTLRLFGEDGGVLLELRCSDAAAADEWAGALSSSLKHLRSELSASRRAAGSERSRRQKWQRLQDREKARRERLEHIRNQGSKWHGLKHTAARMAEGS